MNTVRRSYSTIKHQNLALFSNKATRHIKSLTLKKLYKINKIYKIYSMESRPQKEILQIVHKYNKISKHVFQNKYTKSPTSSEFGLTEVTRT